MISLLGSTNILRKPLCSQVGEMVAAASGDDEILLCKLKEFVPENRPNYIKVTKLNDFSLFVYYRQSANGIRDWLTVTVTC